ncbi:dipeptidyl peptidase 9 isoform X4 [Anopheles sinensis]|uniref:Dipeptidyl peptidase 9 isoform X4 n=1 Tax=Anopheles sinensis TaxID=74873 RepID=A0A084WS01_ANOSI|nr:dipeptidyl peptidase 9 isoform X4 [Anopheles sinensis]
MKWSPKPPGMCFLPVGNGCRQWLPRLRVGSTNVGRMPVRYARCCFTSGCTTHPWNLECVARLRSEGKHTHSTSPALCRRAGDCYRPEDGSKRRHNPTCSVNTSEQHEGEAGYEIPVEYEQLIMGSSVATEARENEGGAEFSVSYIRCSTFLSGVTIIPSTFVTTLELALRNT